MVSRLVDIVFRRLLRFEAPFGNTRVKSSTSSHSETLSEQVTPIPEIEDLNTVNSRKRSRANEIVTTLLAGGLAGSVAAIIPYP